MVSNTSENKTDSFQNRFFWILFIFRFVFLGFKGGQRSFKGYTIEKSYDDDSVMELTTVIKLSPLEKLQRRLLFQEYLQALEIAETYSLDTDIVYKHQIKDMISLKQHFSFFKIEPIFEKVKDRTWVLDICLIPLQNPSLTRSLLDYVISQTNYLTQSDVEQEINAFIDGVKFESFLPLTPSAALRYRAESLLRRDKLDLYEALLSGSFHDFSFISKLNNFYVRTYLDIALDFASKENCSALHIFFARLSAQILPFRFQILDAISDNVEINEYSNLIPKINQEGTVVEIISFSYLRKRDWIEKKEIMDFLSLFDDKSTLELQNDRFITSSRKDWLEWFKKRILRMERNNKGNAYALANLAVSRGFNTEFIIIRDRISILNRISASDFSEKLKEVDLAALENFPPRDLLRSFMILADLSSVEELFSRIIIPYLDIIETPFTVLRDVLIEISSKDLSLLSNLAKTHAISGLRKFSSNDDLKILVIDCVLACGIDDSSENFDEIMDYVFASDDSFKETENDWDSDQEIADEDRDLHHIEEKKRNFAAYVKAKHVLSEYNISKPVSWFAKNLDTTAQQLQIVNEMFQNAVALKADWIRLLLQLDELNENGILCHISRTKLFMDAVKIILRGAGIFFLIINKTQGWRKRLLFLLLDCLLYRCRIWRRWF